MADFLPAINNLSTQLDQAVLVADTTIKVVDTTGWPTEGVFSIGEEAIQYTGISGNDFTGCVRGFDGTVAVDHPLVDPFTNDATEVSLRIIAKHIIEIQDTINGLASLLFKEVTFSDLSPVSLGSIPSGSRVTDVSVHVTEAWDGTNPSIQIGTAGDPDLLMESVESELDVSDRYFEKVSIQSGPLDLVVTVTPGSGASTGKALVRVEIAPVS